MAESTPDEWLQLLSKRMDDRYPRIALLRSYTSGNPPMPEMGEHLRASWVAFQRKATTNYGGLAVESLANRIIPNGIHIGETDDNPAVVTARRIWRDNRMSVAVADTIRDYLTTSIGYLQVGLDSSAQAVITRETPEQFIAATDPLRPWKARATLKVWRDIDLQVDFAQVTIPGVRQMYSRPATLAFRVSRASGGWSALGGPQTFQGDPPTIILERHDSVGLFEPHIPVIDRINLGKLQRLVITAMQAYKQRALKGEVSDTDDEGNPIDLAAMFEPAPGALWNLPEGVDVWESQSTDIRPLLEGEKGDARDFAAVTRTPISVFIPEGSNQSAEGAAAAKEGQIAQAYDEISRIQVGLELAVVYALRAEGVDLGTDTVEVTFVPPEHVSLTEKYTAAAQAKAAGLSRNSILRDILGMSPDKIAQDTADLADEQLQAFALTGGTGAA